MRKENTERHSTSAVHWEHLEEWVRQQVQQLIQKVLEEEVTKFLGRGRSERRSGVEYREGYRNGYGKSRRFEATELDPGSIGAIRTLLEAQKRLEMAEAEARSR